MKSLMKWGLIFISNLCALQAAAGIPGQPAPDAAAAAETTTVGSILDPIRLGAVAAPIHYSHTADTRNCLNMIGSKANECCYAFSVERPMLVVADHVGSEVLYSTIALHANDDHLSHIETCSRTEALAATKELWRHYEAALAEELDILTREQPGQAFMCRIVGPGDYLIVSEGISINGVNNGVIETNIHILDIPGYSFEVPYLSGRYDDEFMDLRRFELENYRTAEGAARLFVKIDLGRSTDLCVLQIWLGSEADEGPVPCSVALRTETGEAVPDAADSGLGNAVISASLFPGSYYVCCEFSQAAGLCHLDIQGSLTRLPGYDLQLPIDWGVLAPGDTRSDIRDSNDYPNVTPVFRNRVYYRFSTEEPVDATLSTQGSPLHDTAIQLVDRNGDPVVWDHTFLMDSCGAYMLTYDGLPAGTYHAIVEGRYANGIIRTSVSLEAFDDPIPEPERFEPTAERNYILSVSPRRAMADLRTETVRNARYAVAYYDGLGRLQQTVLRGAAPDKRDIVAATEYDRHGLVHGPWLPAVHTSTGGFVAWEDAATDFHANTRPYAETTYERSPLHRPRVRSGAGARWHDAGRNTSTEHLVNSDAGPLRCRHFDIWEGSLADLGCYPAGTLSVERTTDEDLHDRYIFTDRFGRMVLDRRILAAETADTYYVYDFRGDLCCVLPPVLAARSDVASGMDDYAYRYVYDPWHRMTEKKLPGVDPVRYIYDASDRPIFTQDGEQRLRGEWTVMLSDVFGRPAITGLYTGTPPADAIAPAHLHVVPDAAQPTGYSLNASFFSLDSVRLLRVAYYDDYAFLDRLPERDDLRYRADARYGTLAGNGSASFSSKSLATGYALYDTHGTSPRYSAVYYDYRHRPIQVRTAGDDGFLSVQQTGYTFWGDPELVGEAVRMRTGAGTDSLVTAHRYDHNGRLVGSTIRLNDSDTVFLRREYDGVGRLSATIRGRDSDARRTDYRYNVRGWLVGRQSDEFSATLAYESPSLPTTAPSYTGNISEWSWRHGSEGELKTYAFSYDDLSRVSRSELFENHRRTDRFVERGLTYDLNGNILTLERTAAGAVAHDLAYGYAGNRLVSLTDGDRSYSYAYDTNGNMTRDGAHGLDLSYNRLNLIEKVVRSGATLANYSYLSDGTKVSATNGAGDGFFYAGSLVYRKAGDRLTLESAGFDGGRFVVTNTGIEPRYFESDHLGSTRVVVNAGGEVLERNDYYPYGMRWSDPSSLLSDNRYGYNGKERQDFVALPYLDYGARMYDSRTGRWLNIDPCLEIYKSLSPYLYCAGSPINHIDKEGALIGFYVASKTGEIVNIPGNEDLTKAGYHYLGPDDAKVGQIKDNYAKYRAEQQVKGAFLMAIFSPDNIGTILGFASGTGGATQRSRQVFANRYVASSSSSVWKLPPLERGWAIERRLGGWCNNYPVIDKFNRQTGIATSIKSMDLNAKSYQKTGSVFNKLKGYIDKLHKFKGLDSNDMKVSGNKILGKELELVLPNGSGTKAQWEQIHQAIDYGMQQNINISIIFMR